MTMSPSTKPSSFEVKDVADGLRCGAALGCSLKSFHAIIGNLRWGERMMAMEKGQGGGGLPGGLNVLLQSGKGFLRARQVGGLQSVAQGLQILARLSARTKQTGCSRRLANFLDVLQEGGKRALRVGNVAGLQGGLQRVKIFVPLNRGGNSSYVHKGCLSIINVAFWNRQFSRNTLVNFKIITCPEMLSSPPT